MGDAENFTSGIEYFNFEEESPYSVSSSSTQKTPLTPSNTNEVARELNMDSTATSESEETYKPRIIPESNPTQEGKVSQIGSFFCVIHLISSTKIKPYQFQK